MNWTLWKRELKANYKMFFLFFAVLAMYIVTIVAMYDPKLGDSLNEMAAAMPQLFAAFGMGDAGATLLDFLVNYLYGFLFVAFPGVYLIILGNRLIARYVDRGSMAYLLATPNARKTIACTQMYFMVFSTLMLVLFSAGVLYACCEAMFPGDLAVGKFVLINVALFGLLLFFGGVCFCASAIFNDTKWSLGISSALIIAWILLQMLADVGDKVSFLNYATPLTLFDTTGLMQGDVSAIGLFLLLYAAGIFLYIVGVVVFCRKDLPL